MQKPRFDDIDFLRAIAIIVVIVTHVLSNNLGPHLINVVWNYLHFIVPILIFCSGYVSYRAYSALTWTPQVLTAWYKKRAVRLVLPYYVIILLHYSLWYVFPSIFSGYGLQKNADFVIRSIFFVGVDYGWLPLLFLQLMVITPLYISLFKQKKTRILTTGILFIVTAVMLRGAVTIDYRLIMWAPWSFVLFLSFFLADYHMQKNPLISRKTLYIIMSSMSLMIFLFLDSVLKFQGRQTTLTLHKYPPDIFYLSYGIGLGGFILLIENTLKSRLEFLRTPVRWLSRYSYELFFAHYLVIDIGRTLMRSNHTQISVGVQSLLVLIVSIEAVHIYTNIRKEIRNRFPSQRGK